MNETKELIKLVLEEIEERNEIGETEIETADLVEELAEALLSDFGKRNLAIHLLRRCGRTDLAEYVQKETAALPGFSRR